MDDRESTREPISPGDRRALIVGMGVTGMAAAVRLREVGWTSVIVERAPGRRSGGYFIVLHGAGQAAAERLGMTDGLHDRAAGGEIVVHAVDRDGNRSGAMRPGEEAPWTLLRGDVESAAFAELSAEQEIRYSTTPTRIVQDADGVTVTLADPTTGAGTDERFDLVIGADGLRSTVRQLAFGPHDQYIHRLGYMIAAFELPSQFARFGPQDGATMAEPGRSTWLFPFTDHLPTGLFSYRCSDIDAQFTRDPIDSLRAAYGPEPPGEFLGWMLDCFAGAQWPLFDSAEQVKMPQWHKGRVVLVGDAAWCLTLYSGMGVSSGLSGADLLGSAIDAHPDDLNAALEDWESRMRPFIDHHQQKGIEQRMVFTPADRREHAMRNTFIRLNQNSFARRVLESAMPKDTMKTYDVGKM